jgi:hypothetical protein
MTVKKTDNKQKDGRHKLTGPGPGRPKGSTNKFTDLKQAYLDVFEKIEKEGQKKNSIIKSLFAWVIKNDRNQGMFYQMLSKMLPSNVTVDGDLNVTFQSSEKFMPKKDNENEKK